MTRIPPAPPSCDRMIERDGEVLFYNPVKLIKEIK